MLYLVREKKRRQISPFMQGNRRNERKSTLISKSITLLARFNAINLCSLPYWIELK